MATQAAEEEGEEVLRTFNIFNILSADSMLYKRQRNIREISRRSERKLYGKDLCS